MSTWIDPQNWKVNYLWQLCQLISYLYVPNGGPVSSPLVTKDLSIKSRPEIVCQGIWASQRGGDLSEIPPTIQRQQSWQDTEAKLHPSWGRPRCPEPPSSAPPPSLLSLVLIWRPCQAPVSKAARPPLWISADRPRQTPGPCLSEPIGWPSLRKVGPRNLTSGLALTGVLTVAIGLLWSLLLSDRQACFTLMAISAAEFPGLDCGSARLQRAGSGLSPSWLRGPCRPGGLPVILLLVPHARLSLLRRQLQHNRITRLAWTCLVPAYPSEAPSRRKSQEEGVPVAHSAIQHLFMLITV